MNQTDDNILKEVDRLKRALLDAQAENSRLSDLLKVWRQPDVPPGWRLVPVEPTTEILAGAAIAAWPIATAADIEMARKAAMSVLMRLDLAAGFTVETLASAIATMAPAYRAMIAAAPEPPVTESDPYCWWANTEDPDRSCICWNESDAQTQVNDHGGEVVVLYTRPAPKRQSAAAPEPPCSSAAVNSDAFRSESAVSEQQGLEWSHTLLDGNRVTYAEAEKAVAELGEGWRLPNARELYSLVDLTTARPAIDTERFPETQSHTYWTSTPCYWSESARWVVHFGDGYVSLNDRTYFACVRAVRDVAKQEASHD